MTQAHDIPRQGGLEDEGREYDGRPLVSAPVYRRIVPFAVGMAILMVTLNASSVAVGLPDMAKELRVEPLRLNMVITAYLVALIMFLPLSGWLAERFGAKRVLNAAILFFAASSIACGLAMTLEQLVAARLLQGCSGAMIAPVGRLILLRSTPRHELIGALSALSTPTQIGPLAGPLLGGLMIDQFSWHWIFLLNLPIALIALMLVAFCVPETASSPVSRIDRWGTLLVGTAMGTLVIGLDSILRTDISFLIPTLLFTTSLLCMLLSSFHARHRSDAVLDLSLFRIPAFRIAVVGGSFFRLLPGAMPFLLAMLFQIAFGMTAFRAGTITFMTAIGSLAMKPLASPIVKRLGFRRLLIGNALINAAIFGFYSLLTPQTPTLVLMLLLSASGFFQALQFTGTWGLAFADVPNPAMGKATTTTAMVQQLVQAISAVSAAAILFGLAALQGNGHLNAGVVPSSFAVIGSLSLLSLLWFFRLTSTTGVHITGKR